MFTFRHPCDRHTFVCYKLPPPEKGTVMWPSQEKVWGPLVYAMQTPLLLDKKVCGGRLRTVGTFGGPCTFARAHFGILGLTGSRFFICHLCLEKQSRHIEIISQGSESTGVQNKHTMIIIIIIKNIKKQTVHRVVKEYTVLSTGTGYQHKCRG